MCEYNKNFKIYLLIYLPKTKTMTMHLRSSASTPKCVQGNLGEPGNSPSIYIVGYIVVEDEYMFEVYSNGDFIMNPFCMGVDIFWEDYDLDLFFQGWWYLVGYAPSFDIYSLLGSTKNKIFSYNGFVYIRLHNTIFSNHECYFSISNFLQSNPLAISEMISPQSGEEINADLDIEYKYSKSKSRARWKNTQTLSNKFSIITKQLEEANLGSRKKYTKKNFQKKVRTNHIKMQNGTEFSSESVINVLEKVLGIFLLKYYDHPLYVGLSAILLMCKNSLSLNIYSIITDVISCIKDNKGTFSDFSNWLKELAVSLDKFKNNKYANSFLELIIKVWTTFLCPTMIYEWTKDLLSGTIGKIMSMFTGSNNPIESIVWASTYLINAVDVFIKDGTMEGFLSTETITDSLAERLRSIRQDYKLYVTGDLEFIKGYKQYAFLSHVEKLRKDLVSIRKSKRGIDLKQIDDWLKEVDGIQVECQRMEAQTGARVQPYHFILTSGSGISKSHLLKLFCNVIAKANNIPCDKEYIFYLNQANKFQSGWSNHKTIIMVDDSAAMHSGTPSSANYLNLADWVLRSSNNVPHELLGADIKEKGTLYNKSLIQGWASNSFTQEFEKYARFASAINRRFQVRIVGSVKPEYIHSNRDPTVKSTRIDYSKIPEDQRNSICPDAWIFTCYECNIQDLGVNVKTDFLQPVNEIDALHAYVVCKDQHGRDMKDMSIADTLKFLQWHSSLHFDNQKKVLDVNEKVYDNRFYCEHGLPKNICCEKCNQILDDQAKEESKFDGIQVIDDHLISPLSSTPSSVVDDCELEDLPFVTETFVNPHSSRINSFLDYKRKDQVSDYLYYKVFLGLMCQSGAEKHITYCKVLFNILSSMRLKDIGDKIKSTRSLIDSMKVVLSELRLVISDYFSGMVCDVIVHICERIFAYIEKFIIHPLAYIPASVEETSIAVYAYSKHHVIRYALMCDYYRYLVTYRLLNKGLHHSKHLVDYSFTRFVYDKFIRAKTPLEQSEEEKNKPMSFDDFSYPALMNISKAEKQVKVDYPDIIRDVLVPLGLTYSTVSIFIPNLIAQFSTLYCEVQVGYDMSVEEVKMSDQQSKVEWYKNKQEVFLAKPLVECNRTYSELENALYKNTFYIKNMSSNKVVSALSFANQYIILPYHFAHDSIGNCLRMVKTRIPSYENCGNAIVEFQLCSKNIFKIPGDLCVVYLEQYMNHMQTKSLLNSFPSAPVQDVKVGRLLFRKYLGEPGILDATNVQYSDSVHNSTPHEGLFKGYYYYSDNFMGLCGAVLVDETHKISTVLGIHVGGNESTKLSVSSVVLRQDLEAAVAHFQNGNMLLQSGFDFKHKLLSNYTDTIYKHNPFLDTLDRVDGIQLLGSAKQRYSYDNKVVYTKICDDVKRHFNVDYEFVAPTFKFNDDKRHGVRQLIRAYGKKNVVRDVGIVDRAQLDLRDRFMYPLLHGDSKNFWQSQIRILNDFEVVNGVLGKRFLGSMNMSTAFGGGYSGSKSAYAQQLSDNTWRFEDWVWDLVYEYERDMDNGIIVPDIVIQQLKLEATPIHKANVGKVRSFFMSSTIMQMVIRRILLTTCRYACMNTKYTEIVVGINAHSSDWTKFVVEITKFGNNRMVALDLTNMDATVLFEVLSGCIDIFFEPFRVLCNQDGKYNNRLAVLKNLLLFPLVDVHGDLVCMSGLLPSGTPLTSMMGCLINSTYYRMAFYYLYNGTKVFSDLVTLRVYGDDSIANVSKDAPFMTVSKILKAWESLGILGTNMEKGSSSSNRKFYKLDEVEFLKRRMVYKKDFGAIVAPLLKMSMFKCLMCHIPPRTVTLEYLTGQCIDNFLFEAKFHGKNFYEDSRRKLRIIAEKHDLLRFCNVLDVPYSVMVEKWKEENSDCVLVTEQWRKCQPLWFRLAHEFNFDIQNWSVWTQNTNENNNFKDLDRSVYKPVVALDEAQLTLQSGVEMNEKQLITFVQSPERMVLDIGSNSAASRIQNDPVELGEFCKRPIEIAKFSWSNAPIFYSIDPWRLLLNNPRLANRISNFNLFRAKCHVKFLLNGNGFFYGRLMVSYLPFAGTTITRPVNAIGQDDLLVSISQMPKVFLDPTTSNGAEMVLPFFYPYSYLSLTNTSAYRDLGTLYINDIAPLKHANQDLSATLERVTVTVYAWFEDVELQGPTQRDTEGLVPQSGRESEDVKKPISQMATNVGNIASAIKQIPVLSPYALAVEKAARMTSNISSALGFCKPIAVAEPCTFIPRPIGSLAPMNTTSSACKLSLDVKQDTSISPLEVNLGAEDQLSFNYISQRDSYFNQFQWTTATTAGTAIQSYVVTPWMYRRGSVDTDRISMTAVCGVANCFKYWTGSLVYRFQIIKSAFHRGRLCIVYDPRGTQVNREENVHFCHVIDIGETSDFELTISNYQDREWLGDGTLFQWPTNTVNTNSIYTAGGTTNPGTNGVITVYIANELTTPNSDQTLNTDITIACYVRAGEDFQVADPRTVADWQLVSPQSGEEKLFGNDVVNADDTGEGIRTVAHYNEMEYFGNKLYMGEIVTSFRSLLKRDNFYAVVVLNSTGIIDYFTHSMYPLYPQANNGFPIPASLNKCEMTMINYVKSAFIGYKGGVRWKLATLVGSTLQIIVNRDESSSSPYIIGSFPYVDQTTLSADLADRKSVV